MNVRVSAYGGVVVHTFTGTANLWRWMFHNLCLETIANAQEVPLLLYVFYLIGA